MIYSVSETLKTRREEVLVQHLNYNSWIQNTGSRTIQFSAFDASAFNFHQSNLTIKVLLQRDETLTVCVYGVLGAGRGGGLRAVAAGAVQRVPASPGGVRIQRTQRERQLVPGRARLTEGGRKMRGRFCKKISICRLLFHILVGAVCTVGLMNAGRITTVMGILMAQTKQTGAPLHFFYLHR